MLVLAIYNLKGNHALLARELAAVLGKTIYEASSRVRAPGGGPSVIASFSSPQPAHQTAAILQQRGFDTLLLDQPAIETDDRRFVVRGFEFGADAVQVQARAAAPLTVRYADIDLVLRGFEVVRHRTHQPRPTRKLSLVRAALSGGLIMTKAVTPPRRPDALERRGFLHLYGRGLPPLVWREGELLYRSLGTALHPSRQANFAQVAALLRHHVPGAVWDERLATPAGQAQLLGPALAPDQHLDVAISLLAQVLRPAASP